MRYPCYLYLLLISIISTAQNSPSPLEILPAFEAYSELPREVVYMHLNKSVFIKGESIGFKAYVLDKATKKRSIETKNLYCIIEDSLRKVVKEQMIKIENGIGSGLIKIDSNFTTGSYQFKAYTNWMRNFSEPNYYEQEITTIDPEKTREITVEEKDIQVDAQFLPESGHALTGISADYGVVIKDEKGFGYPFIEGIIENSEGEVITTFELNAFGIGRFALIPQPGASYFASFKINNKDFKLPIGYIEKQGVTCTVRDLRDKVGLILNAKFNNRAQQEQKFMLSIHDGDSIKALDISFKEQSQVIKVFPDEDLYPGMNVFTLFDSSGTPILERLYFNHKGIEIHSATTPEVNFNADSIRVSLSVNELDPKYWNSLSVSVLPVGSGAHYKHHNLPSYTLLNPYVRGPIENAAYYFSDITPRKVYELDNLLL